MTPRNHTLTTQQAAEMLGISRPTLIKLLDDGKIPFHRPSNHRRVALTDVLDYRERRKQLQYEALDAMAALDPAEIDAAPSGPDVDLIRAARKEAGRRRRS